MQSFTLDSQKLYTALASVGISRSDDKLRPLLNAVLVEMESPDVLRFVATDSFRMAIADIKVDNIAFECSENKSFEPFNLAGDFKPLLAMLKTDKQSSRVIVDGSNVIVSTKNGAQVVVDRLEGTFPGYRDIVKHATVQEGLAEEVAFNPAYMGDIGKAAMLFSGETRKNTKTPVRFSSNGKNKPGRFLVVSNDDTLEQWLMPTRVL